MIFPVRLLQCGKFSSHIPLHIQRQCPPLEKRLPTVYCDPSLQWHRHMWMLLVLLCFYKLQWLILLLHPQPLQRSSTLILSGLSGTDSKTQNCLVLETKGVLEDDTGKSFRGGSFISPKATRKYPKPTQLCQWVLLSFPDNKTKQST
jgi:hypothetical protein